MEMSEEELLFAATNRERRRYQRELELRWALIRLYIARKSSFRTYRHGDEDEAVFDTITPDIDTINFLRLSPESVLPYQGDML
uniref:Uncharacterized protein n=1 Tax=Tetranychus urticae TaxID=32264 RepID=T1KS72_TETUR